MTNHIRFWRCRHCHRTLKRDAFSAKFLDMRTPCDECLRGRDGTLMDAQEGAAQPVYARRRITRKHGTDNRE